MMLAVRRICSCYWVCQCHTSTSTCSHWRHHNHQGNTKKKGESQVPFIRLTVVMEIMTMANNEIKAFLFLFKRVMCKNTFTYRKLEELNSESGLSELKAGWINKVKVAIFTF